MSDDSNSEFRNVDDTQASEESFADDPNSDAVGDAGGDGSPIEYDDQLQSEFAQFQDEPGQDEPGHEPGQEDQDQEESEQEPEDEPEGETTIVSRAEFKASLLDNIGNESVQGPGENELSEIHAADSRMYDDDQSQSRLVDESAQPIPSSALHEPQEESDDAPTDAAISPMSQSHNADSLQVSPEVRPSDGQGYNNEDSYAGWDADIPFDQPSQGYDGMYISHAYGEAGTSTEPPKYAGAPPVTPRPDPHLPKQPAVRELMVTLMNSSQPIRIVIVDESVCKKKQFLGGYRNRGTMLEYHHAVTQTPRPPNPRLLNAPEKLSRESQTKTYVTRSQQTNREQGVQTGEKYNDAAGPERVVSPKRYFSAEEFLDLRFEKAIVIQSHVRAWFARRLVTQMREDLLQDMLDREQQNVQHMVEEDEKRKREIERRMHPHTTEDFRTLYEELELWRMSETEKIKYAENLSPEERKLALTELLKKETKLLQTIDRLKIVATRENRTRRIDAKMEKMAAEKVLNAKTGDKVHIETPFSVRARELADLYKGLCLNGISVDERLEILLHVKWTVKEFDCQLTREIVELIDREADLLNRGRSSRALDGLRRRVSNLFLQFTETPEFNPESLRYSKLPVEYLSRPQVQPIKKKQYGALSEKMGNNSTNASRVATAVKQ
eukprot:ANDGO_06209.mRNA.1 hypothetical protein AMSG_11901